MPVVVDIERPGDLLPDTEDGICEAEHGSREEQVNPTDWLMCWRPAGHEGLHWDDVESVGWGDESAVGLA